MKGKCFHSFFYSIKNELYLINMKMLLWRFHGALAFLYFEQKKGIIRLVWVKINISTL